MGELRRRTAERKETRIDDLEGERSDEPQGEIRPRTTGGSIGRHFHSQLGEEKGRRKPDISDSHRSERRRASIHKSQSSRESGRSKKRANDICRAVETRSGNTNIRDLPSRLRQTLQRATSPPLSLK